MLSCDKPSLCHGKGPGWVLSFKAKTYVMLPLGARNPWCERCKPGPGTISALFSTCLLGNTSRHSRRTWRRGSQKETSMANESKDQPVLGHIDRLVKEEERLYAQSALTDDDRDRLVKIKVELDQCWDLLRQRRALREFGRDPDQAKVRPPKIVENYEQ